jgi:hypothetical protein
MVPLAIALHCVYLLERRHNTAREAGIETGGDIGQAQRKEGQS